MIVDENDDDDNYNDYYGNFIVIMVMIQRYRWCVLYAF